ncbi:MAG: translation initiation factor IF-3 [Candidatus Muiribacteriota bacterium]
MKKKFNYRVNEQIKAEEVRLVGPESKAYGIVPLSEALKVSEDEGLDLVEIAPKAKPPVCKIINFSKFKYEQSKKEKEAKKKQKVMDVKEIRLRPNIEQHDLGIKINNAKKFLNKGDKVRFNLRFKGRQNAHKEQGVELLQRVEETLSEIGKIEKKNINRSKRVFILEISPISENTNKK